MASGSTSGPRLGLGANRGQFALLVGVSALVGGTVGQERTVLPLLATDVFGLTALSSVLAFIVAFGLTKAATNVVAGVLADRYGRKPVLIAGWLAGVPVPLLLIWAPDWGWVVLANVLLGINQGLTWSTTVIMKIDLVGPTRRGLAMGLNEAAGYGAVAVTAFATGLIAEQWGLRPAPFLVGLAYVGLGLGVSTFLVRETRGHAHAEAEGDAPGRGGRPARSLRNVFLMTSFRERSLSAASQAGLVNNLNDGLAWGLLPIYYATAGLHLGEIAILTAVYPAVWGIGQLATGGLSDRIGRKGLIAAGMLVQAGALTAIAATTGFGAWAIAAVALGLGTAMVYPALLAVVGDVAAPTWRASAVGIYRMWRDLGFAIGALVSGMIADRLGLPAAIWSVAILTGASGLVVLARMRETAPSRSSGVEQGGGAPVPS